MLADRRVGWQTLGAARCFRSRRQGAFGIGLGSLLLIFAVQEIGAGPTAVVWSSSPLFALPLAAVFLGERLTVWLVFGTLLAVAGIILLS